MTDKNIPMEVWGKDHRSTIMYAETRAVDHSGRISHAHMRSDGSNYPSTLADGTRLENHNDYDCLRDAEAAGLLRFAEGVVEFTDAGWAYAQGLRRARAERTRAARVEQ